MAATPKTLSRAELKESVDALVDEIVHGDDDYLARYANRLAAERAAGFRLGLFKTWSINNRFYLAAQEKSRGSHLKGLFAGVDQWRKKDRSVRDGERPYIIFGPPAFRRRAPQPGTQQTPNQLAIPVTPNPQANPAAQVNQPAGELVYRRPPIIEVFDWSQTVSNDPDYVEPSWAVPLAAGDIQTLEILTATSPVPVKFIDIASKSENGYLDRSGITIDATMPIGNRISTLVHELTHHHLGHLDLLEAAGDGDRARCEQEAGLAQFFAMKMLGLDEGAGNEVTHAAGNYLRTWTRDTDSGTVPVEGHKTKRKLVLSRLGTALKAADTVVGEYAKLLADREESRTPAAVTAA